MSYLEARPQRVVDEPKSKAWIPVVLIILAILIIIAVIIIWAVAVSASSMKYKEEGFAYYSMYRAMKEQYQHLVEITYVKSKPDAE